MKIQHECTAVKKGKTVTVFEEQTLNTCTNRERGVRIPHPPT